MFNASQPDLMKYAGQQRDTYGAIAPGAQAGIMGAQDLVNRNLSGANLNGNPYLDAILGKTRQDIIDANGDTFGMAGRYGSGMHTAIMDKQLADAENALRYQNYGTERGYQQDAIGQAGNLMQGSQAILNNAAELPWIGVQAANGAVRQASSGYGTSTTTQTPNLGEMLMKAAAAAAQSAAMSSDRRLKRNIERIGEWDDKGDGLGRYRFSYIFDPEDRVVEGVMADEVKELRPHAYIPNFRGEYAGVNYGAL